MSIVADFSFNNELIKAYFKGSDKYIPTSELLYVHSHPLVQPNFITEIESLLNEAGQIMVTKNMKGPAERLIYLAQSLGQLLPILDESNAAEALKVLREIYRFCNQITGKR